MIEDGFEVPDDLAVRRTTCRRRKPGDLVGLERVAAWVEVDVDDATAGCAQVDGDERGHDSAEERRRDPRIDGNVQAGREGEVAGRECEDSGRDVFGKHLALEQCAL